MCDELIFCAGQPDIHFVNMVKAKKGKILSKDGKVVVAFVDECEIVRDETVYQYTVRSSDCELASTTDKCVSCQKYRANLRAMYSRWSKRRAGDEQASTSGSTSSSHTNDRYLNTPEKKAKAADLRKRLHTAEASMKRLSDRICKLTEDHGEVIDDALYSDLLSIMHSYDDEVKKVYPEGSFSRLFWEDQLKAASAKDARQMRWHPLMIKWCLNLKLLSGSAYHALRTSGFVKLPSERTLRDYIHYFSNEPGFQQEVLD